MTTPLTIQLPPNLEQQMLHEAQKQNKTLEHLVLGLIQQHYDIHPTGINSLEEFFVAIHNAIQTKQPIVQAPVDDIYLGIAASLKRSGILLDVQSSDQSIVLYFNPNPPPLEIPSLPDIDPSELDPKLAKIIKDIKDEDETVRFQAIQAIAQWHEQQT
jgi:ribosomal protein S8